MPCCRIAQRHGYRAVYDCSGSDWFAPMKRAAVAGSPSRDRRVIADQL